MKKILKFELGDIVQLNKGWKNRVGIVRANDKSSWVIKNHWDIADCICENSDVIKIIKRKAIPKKYLKYIK